MLLSSRVFGWIHYMVEQIRFCNQVLIWDVESQPNRHAVLGASDSRPDLVGPMQSPSPAWKESHRLIDSDIFRGAIPILLNF